MGTAFELGIVLLRLAALGPNVRAEYFVMDKPLGTSLFGTRFELLSLGGESAGLGQPCRVDGCSPRAVHSLG